MIDGTLSIVDHPTTPAGLNPLTQGVRDNNDVASAASVRNVVGDPHVVPTEVGRKSPIRHVIYVVNENRAYEQALGDLGKGDCDPSLALFGAKVTPNRHALADS